MLLILRGQLLTEHLLEVSIGELLNLKQIDTLLFQGSSHEIHLLDCKVLNEINIRVKHFLQYLFLTFFVLLLIFLSPLGLLLHEVTKFSQERLICYLKQLHAIVTGVVYH